MKSLTDITNLIESTFDELVFCNIKQHGTEYIIFFSQYNSWFILHPNYMIEFILRSKYFTDYEKLLNLTKSVFDCAFKGIMIDHDNYGTFELEFTEKQKLEYTLEYFS